MFPEDLGQFLFSGAQRDRHHVDAGREDVPDVAGLSGSGKSTLAFDTIFAEGQRRYVESLSAYARQFLGRVEKPDVDFNGVCDVLFTK